MSLAFCVSSWVLSVGSWQFPWGVTGAPQVRHHRHLSRKQLDGGDEEMVSPDPASSDAEGTDKEADDEAADEGCCEGCKWDPWISVIEACASGTVMASSS